MTTRSASKFQFASDIDGDLHLFPKNLDEPDYPSRWQVWVRLTDGRREEAVLDSPIMCVHDGKVTNPYYPSGHQKTPACLSISLMLRKLKSVSILGQSFAFLTQDRVDRKHNYEHANRNCRDLRARY